MNITQEASSDKPTRGQWLSEQIKDYNEKNAIESDSEPTEEEISKQIRLDCIILGKLCHIYKAYVFPQPFPRTKLLFPC